MNEGVAAPESVSADQPRPSKYELDNARAAAHLKIKPGTLATWRALKRHRIPFVRVGRKIFYSRDDLDNWLETRRGTEPNPRKSKTGK